MTTSLQHQVFVFCIRKLGHESFAVLLRQDLLQHLLEKLSPRSFFGMLLERHNLEELDRVDAPPGEHQQASKDLPLTLLNLLSDLIFQRERELNLSTYLAALDAYLLRASSLCKILAQ